MEVLQFISNVIMQGYKIPFFELLMPFFERKILLLVSPISLTRFQFLTFVRESKGLFWIFDMSTSLYTIRSLNSKILGIATQLFDRNYCLFKFYLKSATLKFSQTTENFSLSLRILAMRFPNIFSSVCSLQALFRLSSAPYIFTSILKPQPFLRNFEAITEIVEEQGIPMAISLMTV